jgi:hypothetical protein
MTKRYRRTVIEVEVLSVEYDDDEQYSPESLADVAHDIIEGDCSGKWDVQSSELVTPEQMAKLLWSQGSDPGFLIGEDDLTLEECQATGKHLADDDGFCNYCGGQGDEKSAN